MKTLTRSEMFADLIAGKYTGSPGVLWHRLESLWCSDDVLDITCDRTDLHDQIAPAIAARDWQALLVLADQAEEAGVPSEVCELTRQSLRVQYQS